MRILRKSAGFLAAVRFKDDGGGFFYSLPFEGYVCWSEWKIDL